MPCCAWVVWNMGSCVIFSLSCSECVIVFLFVNFSVSYMLLTSCIFLQTIYEPKNTLNKVQVFHIYIYRYIYRYIYIYIDSCSELFSNFLFSMSRGLSCCINPQIGGPGDFWSRVSSSSPWYASIELQGSSACFGPPRVFHFPGTRHIWWAFPYPPPGEAPYGRLATPQMGTGRCGNVVQYNLLNK